MSEPERLLESGSPRLRALVEAGKRDMPTAQTEAGVMGALSLGVAGGATLGVGTGAARSALARALAGLRHVAFSKIGIGVITAAMAGGGGYVAGRVHGKALVGAQGDGREAPKTSEPERESRLLDPKGGLQNVAATATSTPVVHDVPHAVVNSSPVVRLDRLDRLDRVDPVTAPAAIESAPELAARPLALDRDVQGPQPGPLAVSPPARSLLPKRSIAGAPDPVEGSGSVPQAIAAQLQSIRRARAFVQAGDANAAIAELDAYEAKTPHGVFEEEQLALRVRALRLRGDATGAARALSNLETQFPGSVHLAALVK